MLLNLSKFNLKPIQSLDTYINEAFNTSKKDNRIFFLSSLYSEPNLSLMLKYRKCINMVREHDTELISNIKQLNIFKTGDVIYANHMENIIYEMSPDKQYIFKPILYARSVGKFITDKETLTEMYLLATQKRHVTDVLSTNKEKKKWLTDNQSVWLKDTPECNEFFIKHYNLSLGAYRNDDEKYIVRKRLTMSGQVYLQEVVDFTHEFRILCFKGTKGKDFVVEYREGYGPNDNRERTHVVSRLKKYIGKKYEKIILDKAEEFVNATEHMAISLDIYFNTKNNDFGMFEYSTQFGIVYPKDILRKISKQFNKAFDLEIKKLTKV